MSMRTVLHLVGILCVPMLGACSSDQLPMGATLTIAPSSRTIDVVQRLDEDGRCRFSDDNHVDLPFVFALRDGQGSPVGGVELSVYVDFAANTYAGYPALALYEDLNGNGVVDEETELVSGVENDIARIDTDRFGGDGSLLLRVNLSCPYRGDVFAFVGGVSASSDIEVAVSETIEDEPREVEPSGDVDEPGTEDRS